MTPEFDLRKKGEEERILENASEKVQTGAKALVNKVKDPNTDLDTEYTKEKIKVKFD